MGGAGGGGLIELEGVELDSLVFDDGAIGGRSVLLGVMLGFLVSAFDADHREVGMPIPHLAGHADVVTDIGDVRGGQDDVPVPMAMAGPAVEPRHRAVSFLRLLGPTGEIEAVEVLFAPSLRKHQLGFIAH